MMMCAALVIAAIGLFGAIAGHKQAQNCAKTGACKSELIQLINKTPATEHDVEAMLVSIYTSLANAVDSSVPNHTTKFVEAGENWKNVVTQQNAACVRDRFSYYVAQAELNQSVAAIVVESMNLVDAALGGVKVPLDPTNSLGVGPVLLEEGMALVLVTRYSELPFYVMSDCQWT